MKNGNIVKVNILEERLSNFMEKEEERSKLNSDQHNAMFESMKNLKENHIAHLAEGIEKIKENQQRVDAKIYFAMGAISTLMFLMEIVFKLI